MNTMPPTSGIHHVRRPRRRLHHESAAVTHQPIASTSAAAIPHGRPAAGSVSSTSTPSIVEHRLGVGAVVEERRDRR